MHDWLNIYFMGWKIFTFIDMKGLPSGSGVKNLPVMQETPVQSLGWEDGLEGTPVFLPGKSHGQRSLAGYAPWGHKESDPTEAAEHTTNT